MDKKARNIPSMRETLPTIAGGENGEGRERWMRWPAEAKKGL